MRYAIHWEKTGKLITAENYVCGVKFLFKHCSVKKCNNTADRTK